VFRAAVGRLPEFRRDRPGDTFRGWLRAITRNQAIAHHRRGRGPAAAGGSTAHLVITSIPDEAGGADDDPPAEVNALYRRALELVRGEFEARTWDMFWQVVVDDRPTADVAAALGVTPAAVRQAKARVLRRLKEEVGDAL
jgi:RNA polymerase sigma-70 factor (ECF subfamily)